MFTNEYDEIVDYNLEVSRGNVLDTEAVHKFGLAQSIASGDGEVDIWDGVNDGLASKITPYNWIDSGPVDLQISSSSTADVGIEIQGEGLDENWDLARGSVVLDGQNAVSIGLQRNRIHRAYNNSGTPLVGIVYVSDAGTTLVAGVPQDDTKIRAIIHPSSQQTQMALYTVPNGHSLYITHGWANVGRSNVSSGQAGVVIYRRSFGGVFRTVHTLAISVSGSSGDHRPYALPLKFEAKEDLIYRANVSANGMAVSAGFHGILIKE